MKNKYIFWESIGSPKTALAPMVDYCDLPFRVLCHRYGVQLFYTQMFNSKELATSETSRNNVLKQIDTNLNSPCFIQLNGHDPELLLKSAQFFQDKTPCIDLNLGCPQNIAKKGYYGAFLLDNTDEVYKIVGYLCNNLKCAVSCKIRLFPDLNKTYELVRKLEELGISCLCVHGRTKEQIKDNICKCNWDAIRNIKQLVNIPVIANGGLGNFEDIDKCFEYTKCDCVMSGEKLIEMPTFFTKKYYDVDDIVYEYLTLWNDIYKNDLQYINDNISILRGHLFKMYFKACRMDIRYNSRIGLSRSIDDLFIINKDIRNFWKDVPIENKYGWYFRHLKRVEQQYPATNQFMTKVTQSYNDDDVCIDDLFTD